MKKEQIVQAWLLFLGAVCTAFSVSVFFTPNKIVGGGVSGISTVLYYAVKCPVGLSYALINIILLIIGLRFLGKGFVIKSIISAALVSLFMEIFMYFPVLTYDRMMAMLFGGIICGAGAGLTFVAKGSTGGTDILGRVIQSVFPNMPIGKLVLILDAAIILSSAAVFKDSNLVLSGIMAVAVQAAATDALIAKLNAANIVYVITDDSENVRNYMRGKIDRGVTELKAYGYAGTEKNKQFMICVMNSKEAADFKEELHKIDKESFVVFSEAKSIIGKGFSYYK